MNKNTNYALNSTPEVLKILEFIPHSKILTNLSRINKFFHHTIRDDFEIFDNYTLKFDCGRRGSFLGNARKGFVDNKGNLKSSKNPEVIINDKQQMILITTSNKPLRNPQTKEALVQISKTAINKIYFRSYRIPEKILSGLSAPSSANSTPLGTADNIAITAFQPNKLLPIAEVKMNENRNTLSMPPPAPSAGQGRNRFLTDESISYTASTSSHPSQNSLTAPSPTVTAGNRTSYSSTISTIDSSVMELSSSLSSTVRMSTSLTSTYDMRDDAFETLLEILRPAPFESLTIGEECVSWQWSNVMECLQSFSRIRHLAVHIGFERDTMPFIKSEQKWLDFVGNNHTNVLALESVYCNDDAFLRCITSLSLYRNLGKSLAFVEEPMQGSTANAYEKGSLKNRLKNINTRLDDDMDENDISNVGHYERGKTGAKDTSALSFVRYRCWDAPEHDLSGIEFDGAKVFELTPYDCMFMTIPQSVQSFRISIGGSFYEEPDEYKIVVPFTNALRELCIYDIHNLDKMEALYHLRALEYLVIKKRPKDKDLFMKYVQRLCKSSPIKRIVLMFNHAKYRKKDRYSSSDNEYWYNLKTISIKEHPCLIEIKDNYEIPNDMPILKRHKSLNFSDYKSKN